MLTPLPLELDDAPPAAAAAEFLRDAQARVDAYLRAQPLGSERGFLPSDYRAVHAALRALRAQHPELDSFCEWGSGFGVVAGLAGLLGLRATAIEIDPELVAASRALMRDHGLDVDVLEGSFLPADFAAEALADAESRTVTTGAGALDEVDVAVDDFDLVYVFPWPTEHELYLDLFAARAAHGAVLLTWEYGEGVRAYRRAP